MYGVQGIQYRGLSTSVYTRKDDASLPGVIFPVYMSCIVNPLPSRVSMCRVYI